MKPHLPVPSESTLVVHDGYNTYCPYIICYYFWHFNIHNHLYVYYVAGIVATIENILSNVISLSWSKLPFPSYANIMYCVSAYFRNLTTQESRPLDERCTSDNNSFLCLSDTSTVSNKLSCKEVNISVTPYIQNFPREPASELSVSALTGIKGMY